MPRAVKPNPNNINVDLQDGGNVLAGIVLHFIEHKWGPVLVAKVIHSCVECGFALPPFQSFNVVAVSGWSYCVFRSIDRHEPLADAVLSPPRLHEILSDAKQPCALTGVIPKGVPPAERNHKNILNQIGGINAWSPQTANPPINVSYISLVKPVDGFVKLGVAVRVCWTRAKRNLPQFTRFGAHYSLSCCRTRKLTKKTHLQGGDGRETPSLLPASACNGIKRPRETWHSEPAKLCRPCAWVIPSVNRSRHIANRHQ